MKQRPVLIICLAMIAITMAISCSGRPAPAELLPTSNLPAGVAFNESADVSPNEDFPEAFKENVESFSEAIYDCSDSGDAHIMIMKCHGDEAAQLTLEDLRIDLLDESVYEIENVEFNGHEAIQGYVPSAPEYVYMWQNKGYVFIVVGSTKTSTLDLAKATKY